MEQRAVAKAHGVQERTVRNWMKASTEPPRKEGRPGHSKEERYHALRAVAREYRQQRGGWRPIGRALKGKIQTRLVQEMLQKIKRRKKRRHGKHLGNASERVTVLVQNVIVVHDGTHLGRKERQEVKGQVVKDRGTLEYVVQSVGVAPTSEDVLNVMKSVKVIRGELPLVWQEDNESIHVDQEVKNYLHEERVVHLLSRVRHPSDNGAAEIGIRELKELAQLGKGVKLNSISEPARRFANSAVQINANRLRGSKGYLTANELAETMPCWYNTVSREVFYQEACDRMETAAQGKEGNHARKAQRDAVYEVLEKYRLIERTRGGMCQNDG